MTEHAPNPESPRPVPTRPRRRRLPFVLVVGALAVAGVVLACWAGVTAWKAIASSQSVLPSEETYYIDGPFLANGEPDYRRHFWELELDGHDPDDNALLPLYEALGDAALDGRMTDPLFEELRLPPPPKRAFMSLEDFVRTTKAEWGGEACSDGCATRLLAACHNGALDAWDPVLEAWFDWNAVPLERLETAARRPVLGVPRSREGFAALRVMSLVQASWALACRGILRARTGDTPAAVGDLVTLARLGSLWRPDHDFVTFVVGASAIDRALLVASHLTTAGDIPGPVAMAALQHVAGLDVREVHAAVARRERIETLAGIHTHWRDGHHGSEEVLDPTPLLRRLNAMYDELDAAVAHDSHAAREEALRHLRERWLDQQQRSRTFVRALRVKVHCFLDLDCQEVIADVLALTLGMGLASDERYAHRIDRIGARRDQLRLVFALAAHYAERGVYPAALEHLVPGYLASVPVHPVHEARYHYDSDGEGYELRAPPETMFEDEIADARIHRVR
jgi:hypothetical protein